MIAWTNDGFKGENEKKSEVPKLNSSNMLGIPALDASVKNRCTREHVIIAEKHSKLPGLVNYIIYSEFTIFIPGQRDPQVAAD